MKDLTNRQKEVASFIGSFMRDNGFAPSVRDIAGKFGFSVKAAHDHLKALERKGAIRMTRGVSRSIELVDTDFALTVDTVKIPVIGTIAAGKPLLSEENIDYSLDVPVTMLKNTTDTYFALKVRGDSMIEAGIFDGDIAILKKCDTAERGDIVAASVEDDDSYGITLKKFYPRNDCIELRPCNSSMGPIVTHACHIHGKLQMLLRTY